MLPEFDGSTDDRSLYDIMPFLNHLASVPTDVREEIKLYGSDTAAANFNQMRNLKRSMIHRNQERGLSGVVTNLSKAQGDITEEQRQIKQNVGMVDMRQSFKKFGQ